MVEGRRRCPIQNTAQEIAHTCPQRQDSAVGSEMNDRHINTDRDVYTVRLAPRVTRPSAPTVPQSDPDRPK